MILRFSKEFQKRFKKIDLKTQKQVELRIRLFATDPTHPQLNNHRLRGNKKDCSSINISGDIRALYELTDKDAVLFLKVGTHSELY